MLSAGDSGYNTFIRSCNVMKIFLYFVFLSEILENCGTCSDGFFTGNRNSFLMRNQTNEIFLRRTRRYLVFEKGSTVTVQGNIAKSVIPPAPRGLNFITEYTLSYELPTDFLEFEKKYIKTTRSPSSPSTTPDSLFQHDHLIVPYSQDYFYHMHPEYEYMKQRKIYSFSKKSKCFKQKFYNYNRKYSNVCLSRGKRYEDQSLSELTVSQRMLYDLIEKWSLLHGFLPRYCFMRTLCESSELLLPYGRSLLHDIIHILLRYTKPWTIHHKIFGRSLRHWNSIDKCAQLYGLYCRVSWLNFITNVAVVMVPGSRAADFMS